MQVAYVIQTKKKYKLKHNFTFIQDQSLLLSPSSGLIHLDLEEIIAYSTRRLHLPYQLCLLPLEDPNNASTKNVN